MTSTRKIISVLVTLSSIFVSHYLIADQLNDSKLSAAVKSALEMEQDIPETDIQVSTKDGVVKLSGVVDTRLQAHKVAELAQSVNGVTSVDDKDLETRSSNAYFSDAMITAKVKGKIKQLSNQQRISKDYKLHVETTNGVVHIFGKVGNNRDVKEIKDSVYKMDKVKGVKLNIN